MVLVEENERAQKIPRKTFNEQSGAGAEGGDIHINDRPGGKREELPPGNQRKIILALGLELSDRGKIFGHG